MSPQSQKSSEEIVAGLFGQLGIPLRCDGCGRLTGETDIGCKLCKIYREGKKRRGDGIR